MQQKKLSLTLQEISKLPLGVMVIGKNDIPYNITKAKSLWIYCGIVEGTDLEKAEASKRPSNSTIIIADPHPFVQLNVHLFEELKSGGMFSDCNPIQIISHLRSKNSGYRTDPKKGVGAFTVNHHFFDFLLPNDNENGINFLQNIDHY